MSNFRSTPPAKPQPWALLSFLGLVASVVSTPLHAGRYPAASSQAFSFANGTVAGGPVWSDGTSLFSTLVGDPPVPTASIQGNALQLTSNNRFDAAAAFKLPDLDVGQDVSEVTVGFSLRLTASGTSGQGISVNFGEIPEGMGAGELGWPLPGGFSVAWETSGAQAPGQIQGAIVVYANNTLIGRYPTTFANDVTFRAVVVRYDAAGLDVRWNNVDIVLNLPLPGVVPGLGHRVALSARNGAATSQDILIDNLSVITKPTASILAGGPVISEFVAFNSSSYQDEDLESPDWIELVNGSPNAVSLAGWHLTNDPANMTKWALPAVMLPANGYRVVFASGKNRAATTGQLHTNFTLQREGGYLALVRPNESVASEYVYGPQFEDIPHGEVGSVRVRGYLETPTPGTKNVSLVGGGAPADAVRFSRPGGLLPNGTTVSLSIASSVEPGSVVRYSIGQAVPTELSPLYTGPIAITTTTTIRARVFAPGSLPGPVSSRTFLQLDPSLTNFNESDAVFSSNLPIIVFDSHGVNVDATVDPNAARPYRPTYGVVIAPDPATGRARLDGPAAFQGRGGTHVRGESSSGFDQKSYSWETWDNRDRDQDESFLGLPSESDWALIAPWSEKTMLRNYLVFSCFDEMRGDWVAPRTRFVEVFFNQQAGQPVSFADYRGCYLLVERIKRSSNRTDIAATNPLVTDPALLTGGYIFKTDKANPGPTAWTTSRGVSMQSSDPGVFSTAQRDYLRKYLNDYEAVLQSTSFSNPQTGYAAWIDVPSFIDAQWAVEISKQIDGYVFSTYYHKDRGGKVRAGPLWDFNISMGNANYAEGEFRTGWNYDPAPRTAPLAGGLWYSRLQADPNYRVATFDRYWQLRTGTWDTQSLMARIDAAAALLTDNDPTLVTNTSPSTLQNPVARHYRKFRILGTSPWPNPSDSTTRKTYQSEVAHLKQWMTERLAWIDNQFQVGSSVMRPPVVASTAEGPGSARVSLASFAATISGVNFPSGVLHYTTDGTDPRPLHFGMPTSQSVTLLNDYGSGSWFIPTATNGGDGLAPTAWTTVDDPPNLASWATGTLGIGFDTQPSSTSNPTLYHVGGAHMGDTTWTGGASNVQAAMLDQSAAAFMRVPFTLTADQRERLATLTLRIRYDDGFIAFVNGVEVHRQHITSDTPADWNASANATPTTHTETASAALSAFNLSHAIPHLRQGANMLAIVALNKTAADSDFLCSPSLTAVLGVRPATAPAITAAVYSAPLLVPSTTAVKARLYWPQTGMWGPLANSAFAATAVPASKANLTVSEIHYNPVAPNALEIAAGGSQARDFEFIELLNTSASDTIDLGGVRLTGAVQEFNFSTADSSARIVPPGGRVIVCAHAGAFQARYGSLPVTKVAGAFAGNLNNSGETIIVLDPEGDVLWSIPYSNQAPWPAVSDGASIVLNNPARQPASDPAIGSNWRASPGIGGAPGQTDSVPFGSLDPGGDVDGDLVPNFLEYIMGSDPTLASSTSALAVVLVPGATPQAARIQFEFPRNLAADGYTLLIESSTDLLTWRADPAALTFVGTRRDGSGRQIETWTTTAPANSSVVPVFFRLSGRPR